MSNYGPCTMTKHASWWLLLGLSILDSTSGFSLSTHAALRTKVCDSKDVARIGQIKSERGVEPNLPNVPSDILRRAPAINMQYMAPGRYSTRGSMYDDYSYRPVTGGGDVRGGGNVRDMSWMGNGGPMFYDQANRYGYNARRGRYDGMGSYGRYYDGYNDYGRYNNYYGRYDYGNGYNSRNDRAGWGPGRYGNEYSTHRRYGFRDTYSSGYGRYDDMYDRDMYDGRYGYNRYNSYNRYDRGYGYGNYGSRYMPDTGGGDIRQGGNVRHISWSGNDDMKFLPGAGSRREVQIEHHLKNGNLGEARQLGWRD